MPLERVPIPLSVVSLVATKAVFIPIEVENLVDLSMLAIQNEDAEGQVFNGVDSHSTFGEVINAYARGVLGKKTYRPSPFSVDSATATISAGLRAMGKLLDSDSLNEASKYFSDSNYRISNQKAIDVLGYRPRVSFLESIRATKDYVDQHGIIRSSQIYK